VPSFCYFLHDVGGASIGVRNSMPNYGNTVHVSMCVELLLLLLLLLPDLPASRDRNDGEGREWSEMM